MDRGLPALSISRDHLNHGPIEYAGELRLPEDWGPAGFQLSEAPRVALTVEASGDRGVRLTGTLTARLRETCSRCVRTVERDREIPIDLRFEPDLDPWDEGPGLYALDANREELEIGPALREELILGLPDYPLCEPNCRGLCPRCGADLNEGECDCAEEHGDSRWESLRRQIEQQDG